MTKYIVYCRKSTESEHRQMLSLQAQRDELDRFIARDNLSVVKYFSESGSAYKTGREKFAEMVEMIKEGKAEGILVWQYNRLARNWEDGGTIFQLIDSGALKEIKTPTGTIEATGNSKFMLALEFALSKKSSDDNSESVKRGNRAKKLEGWDTHKHAGYMFVEDPATYKRVLVPDPDRYNLIKEAIGLVLNGQMPPAVLEKLNNEWGYRTPKTRRQGNKPMSMSNFYKILHDEFYCGWIFTADGERLQGRHEPMIRDEDYDRLQAILGAKGKPRPKSVDLPYRGLMWCGECGSAVCLEEKHQIICSRCKTKFAYKNKLECPHCQIKIMRMDNPTRLHYIYARCTKKKNKNCTQKTIRVDRLENQIKDYIMSLEISQGVHDWVLGQLRKDTTSQLAVNAQALKNLQTVVKGTQEELDSLLIQYTQPENRDRQIISNEEYLKRKKSLEDNKKKAEEDLGKLSKAVKYFMDYTERKFDFAVDVIARFNGGGYETRTDVFKNLGSNLKLLNRKVLMDEDNLNIFIRKANQNIRAITNDPLEPEKSIGIYEKTGVVSPVMSILQGWKESNLR